jgi:hypothetical protein
VYWACDYGFVVELGVIVSPPAVACCARRSVLILRLFVCLFTAERAAVRACLCTHKTRHTVVRELDVKKIRIPASRIAWAISLHLTAPHTMIVAFVCASAVWASARAACPAAPPAVNENRGSCDSRQLRTDTYADCQAACCE